MKENIISKINKVGKVSDIILTIFKVITIIAMVGILIATVVFAVMPKDFIKVDLSGSALVELDIKELGVDLSEFDEGEIKNTLSEESGEQVEIDGLDYFVDSVDVKDGAIFYNATAQTQTVYLKNLYILMLAAFVFMLAVYVSLIFAGKMCKALKTCETPFEEKVIKSMQKFGYSLIPWALLTSVVESISDSFISGNIRIGISIDVSLILIVVVVIVLSYIFKYGAMLQQESDETL